MGTGAPGNSRAEGMPAMVPGLAAGATVGGGPPPSCTGRKGLATQSRGRVVVTAENLGTGREEGAGATQAGEGPTWEKSVYTSKQCLWLPTHEECTLHFRLHYRSKAPVLGLLAPESLFLAREEASSEQVPGVAVLDMCPASMREERCG